MSTWDTQGCSRCRQGVLSGMYSPEAAVRHGLELLPPAHVATNLEAHAHLHHCSECDAWWEFGEREAHVISESEAHKTFAGYFNG
jgi:hypothetical protein